MRRLLPSLVFIAACGQPDPKTPASNVNVDVAGTSTPPVAVASTGGGADRGPSRAIGEHWVLGPNLDMVVWVDLKALASTALVKAIVPTVLGVPEIAADARTCVEAVLAHGQEVLFGVVKGRRLAVMRVDGTLEGACPDGRLGGDAVGYMAGWAFYGDDEDVKAALAGKSGALPDMNVERDELLVARGKPGPQASFDGSLVMNDARIKGVIDATLPDEDSAVDAEKTLAEMKQRGRALGSALPDKSAAPTLDHLFQAWTFSRAASKVHVQIELVEGPDAQARDVGALSTLSLYAIRKYITTSKEAEAKNSLGQIARDIVTWDEAEEFDPHAPGQVRGPGQKKLFSIPATPSKVPKGVTYQSVAADWRPWNKLRFEMTAPQRYQYEVKAAKDGKSASIIARGDLNGDGKTSEFVVSVAMKDGHIVVSPTIKETDPEE